MHFCLKAFVPLSRSGKMDETTARRWKMFSVRSPITGGPTFASGIFIPIGSPLRRRHSTVLVLPSRMRWHSNTFPTKITFPLCTPLALLSSIQTGSKKGRKRIRKRWLPIYKTKESIRSADFYFRIRASTAIRSSCPSTGPRKSP